MISIRMPAKYECQCQQDENGKKGKFDIRAKDREPFTEMQGHDRTPCCSPDEKQGDKHFDDGIDPPVAPNRPGVLQPEGFNGDLRVSCCGFDTSATMKREAVRHEVACDE